MTWAETGVSCPGKTKIRLDCVSENKALQSFYSGMGYESKGLAPGYHLFEKDEQIKAPHDGGAKDMGFLSDLSAFCLNFAVSAVLRKKWKRCVSAFWRCW